MTQTQTIFGQSDALARDIVTALTGGSFCLSISAHRIFARKVDLDALPAIGTAVRVDVIPTVENEDREGLADVFRATYGVHILIQQKVGAAAETQCPLLMQLRSQIIALLQDGINQGTAAVRPFHNAGVIAVRSAPEGVYDLGRLEGDNLFYSDTMLTYRTFV